MLSGSGLIGAGGYVYWMARKPMKLGYPPGPGTIAQMIFGISESLGTTLGPGERERETREIFSRTYSESTGSHRPMVPKGYMPARTTAFSLLVNPSQGLWDLS